MTDEQVKEVLSEKQEPAKEEEKLNKKVATDIMKRELRNIKRMNKTPCETCDVHPAQLELTDCWDRNVRYLLCANCIKKLINYRLSPSEFKRLLEGGHLIEEFYLHEDFYDDEGNALQPQ